MPWVCHKTPSTRDELEMRDTDLRVRVLGNPIRGRKRYPDLEGSSLRADPQLPYVVCGRRIGIKYNVNSRLIASYVTKISISFPEIPKLY